MSIPKPIIYAALFAALTLPVHLIIPFWWSHQYAALPLVAIPAVLVGLAANDGRVRAIVLECLVALAAMGFVAASLIYEPNWIPVAYIVHAGWVRLHTTSLLAFKIPAWFIPACATYELLAGLGIGLIWALR